GADDFIGKPYKQDELFQKLAAWLHVDYVYAEQEAADAADWGGASAMSLTATSLSKLPHEILEQMGNAAAGGYQDRLLVLIDQVETQDEQAAHALRNLAVGFQYEKLIELLKGRD
ncbi:MAG TPA: hypothetical protein VF819_09530, partial [Nitrospira sp.]